MESANIAVGLLEGKKGRELERTIFNKTQIAEIDKYNSERWKEWVYNWQEIFHNTFDYIVSFIKYCFEWIVENSKWFYEQVLVFLANKGFHFARFAIDYITERIQWLFDQMKDIMKYLGDKFVEIMKYLGDKFVEVGKYCGDVMIKIGIWMMNTFLMIIAFIVKYLLVFLRIVLPIVRIFVQWILFGLFLILAAITLYYIICMGAIPPYQDIYENGKTNISEVWTEAGKVLTNQSIFNPYDWASSLGNYVSNIGSVNDLTSIDVTQPWKQPINSDNLATNQQQEPNKESWLTSLYNYMNYTFTSFTSMFSGSTPPITVVRPVVNGGRCDELNNVESGNHCVNTRREGDIIWELDNRSADYNKLPNALKKRQHESITIPIKEDSGYYIPDCTNSYYTNTREPTKLLRNIDARTCQYVPTNTLSYEGKLRKEGLRIDSYKPIVNA